MIRWQIKFEKVLELMIRIGREKILDHNNSCNGGSQFSFRTIRVYEVDKKNAANKREAKIKTQRRRKQTKKKDREGKY